MNWLAEKIDTWPVAKLLPYARNARTHSDEQIAKIAASIAEFGFVNPILAGADGLIVAGHGRLLAARKLGLDEVPVVVLDHLSDTQRRALVLADNRLAELSSWDQDLLRIELEALEEADFDLDLTGFDEAFLDDLFSEEPDNAGHTDPDSAPEAPTEPITQPGDIWQLGEHRLVCGDATDALAYQRLFPDDHRADMVFTDPPYNVNYAAEGSVAANSGGQARPIMNDALGSEFEAFLLDALSLLVAHTQGALYIAMSSSELDTLQSAFRRAGGHWSTFVIWAKNTFTLGRSDYQRQYEPILYGWPKDSSHHWCGDRNQGDVWPIDKPRKNDLHPTMKPVALVERAIRNSSKPGDTVLDAFAGSGTTLIAAAKTGRQARLLELDPKYCDVIVKRWQDWSGETAERIAADEMASEVGERD